MAWLERLLFETPSYPLPPTVSEFRGSSVVIDGKPYLCFCNNDYLGFGQDPRVREAAARVARDFGWGTGASRALCGSTTWHVMLEECLAAYAKCEAAILYNSAYLANCGAITALANDRTWIAIDAHSHASSVDGARLTGGTVFVFPHRDMGALEEGLRKAPAGRRLILSDAVFPRNGDLSPVQDLLRLADEHDAALLIDESHGIGVYGEHGRGLLEETRLEGEPDLVTGSFTKALGGMGGYVLCNRELARLLRARSKHYVFTQPAPPAQCAATMEAIDLLEQEPERRARLWENARSLRGKLEARKLDLKGSAGPLVPVGFGSDEATIRVSKALWEAGIYAPTMKPPAVPPGDARIRLVVTSMHSKADLDRVVEAIDRAR